MVYFSSGTSTTNHPIGEILLKVALSTIILALSKRYSENIFTYDENIK